ncbi:MAG: TonB-dependent receptor, partial [Bacteroidota bacterium]
MISQPLYAQEKGTVRGVVKDSLSLESLPFGNVFIKELNVGTSTNNRGYFVIPSVPANKNLTVVVSYVGYKKKELRVLVNADTITDLEILLPSLKIQFETIEKIERIIKENVPDVGKIIITPKEIENIPKGVETDLLRSLASLPGVQSTGDVSAKFNVRGGETNQNLILLDGMPVYYPFHAIGLFSIIDPNVINNVEFFKGGFSANYGRAISSIIKIDTKDGDRNNLRAKLSASLLSAKGLIEGPIPSGSFFVSARKSLSNSILKKFVNENDLPIDFYDASLKINFADPDFFSGSKFSL